MRIVIDLQGAQTESLRRGIGRYSIALTQEILRQGKQHEVIVALNGLLQDSIPTIREALAGLLPEDRILTWSAIGPASFNSSENNWRRLAGELARDYFFASLDPDVVLVTSLFEGFNDDAICSIRSLPDSAPTAVILYDFIPLLHPEQYVGSSLTSDWYRRRVSQCADADGWLAISAASGQEGQKLLGLSASRIFNISTAADSRFRPITLEPAKKEELLERLGIRGPFVLTSGGGEYRKNVIRLIAAFARLPSELSREYQLVICGCNSDIERKLLIESCARRGLTSDQVLLLQHISDADLIGLYNSCSLFVFPSWYEGFGMPPLEAMQCGAPVIGANSSSLPEVIGKLDALFDPFSVDDIASLMTKCLTDADFRHSLVEHGLIQSRSFSWEETARRAIAALEKISKSRPSRRLWRKAYGSLVQEVGAIASAVTEDELSAFSAAIAENEMISANIRRSIPLPSVLNWRIEGPFDSSYSLALLNRETARALSELGHRVALHSTEGPGDFLPNAEFLQANPDLASMNASAASQAPDDVDVVSRNLYPPRVDDMRGRLNLLHHYAWEESGFPWQWTDNFNAHLDGITCLSTHVKKVLVDSGVTVPLSVSNCGVDHWERITPDAEYRVEGRAFRFLHVSSCFPRKGADLLLEAFGSSFTADDDVTLIVKTFPNPHNEIRSWLRSAQGKRKDFPNVIIIEDDLSDAQLKALYQQCHALVAPSRAEGFGLPMAEAMLSGLPVITTAWGGQLDFCNDKTAWLVDYDFEKAQSHFGIFDSVWAAPRSNDLSSAMKAVYDLPSEVRQARVLHGRELLLEKFKWRDVANRLVSSARRWSADKAMSQIRVGWVSTWNTRCGIATYSEHLVRELSCPIKIFAPDNQPLSKPDQGDVSRCWSVDGGDDTSLLEGVIDQSNIDVIVIQFNYGFFDFSYLKRLLDHLFASGKRIVMMMHSTQDANGRNLSDLLPQLMKCDRLLVHSIVDMNRLKRIGLTDNVTLFPHGVLTRTEQMPKNAPNGSFVIASYGFFLPNKGLLELIDACDLLLKRGNNIRLKMINAEYPSPLSTNIIEKAKRMLVERGLEGKVELTTDFLSDEESLSRLEAADLIVFPYQATGESASGAVRYGLASAKPVAVTPLPIFDDIADVVFRLPGCSAEDIARGISDIIGKIAGKSADFHDLGQRAKQWQEAHQYPMLANRLENLLTALVRQPA